MCHRHAKHDFASFGGCGSDLSAGDSIIFMAVDYDLVIIGSSYEGIYAAKTAARLQARVALVTQGDTYLPNDVLVNHSIGEIGQLNHQLRNNPFATASEIKLPYVSCSEASDWAKGVDLAVQTSNSLSSLAALGVDVIVGKGEFCRLPQLAFNIANRRLRSRNFLLATGANFVPHLNSNESNYLTLRKLWHQDLSDLRQQIIIIGSDPTALELAQTLARFEKQVTLVVRQPRILPQEDPDVAMLVQAELEAEEIKIYTNSPVSQLKAIEDQKWLQAGDRALSTDEIIIADYRQPNITGLNLAGVDVKYDEERVYVNQRLQTSNPNIYACGDLIGGYCLPNIAQYEVNIILKNTLFLPWYKTNYYCLPWAVLTQPNLARVGLTQRQAKQQFGENIYVIKQYLNNLTQAQILDRTTGVCKLIVRENGEILGCSLVSDRAAELITIIALMIQHKINLDPNPMRGLTSLSIPTIYPAMVEILQQCCHNFYQQKLQRNSKLLNRLKTWFSLQRSWYRK
ncbi:NAD(P)/FAD-dependent oxidoreductase [Pleurocapsales cyanobacterium LEGE 10410]|nr:NAD(P)/FAD-dependent oxidoreductase [Pleurocapsales cyanobacterium LEGE 10410]